MNHREAEDLRERLLSQLRPATLSAIGAFMAAAGNASVYIAGGAARDALIGRPIVDVDIAVEGDAIAIARKALPHARITAHPRFGTASIVVDSLRIDVASTRRETYARPAALPSVESASISDDLRRRDFSINAMALRISGPAQLVDPCGGAADVAAHRLRVLHDASFVDDPTRIFRAIRYASRLEFEIEPATSMLMRDAIGDVGALSGDRVRRELELILQEETAGVALETAHAIGAIAAAHAALTWDRRRSVALNARPARVPVLPFGFALLALYATATDAESIVARMRLRRSEAQAVRAVVALRQAESMLRRPDAKPSGVVLLLERYPPAAVAAFALASPDAIVRQVALRYLDEWRHVKTATRGTDLQRLGVPEGPHVARGLRLIRAAKLDGWAPERRDEEALALRFAKSIRDSAAVNAGVELHLNGD